MKSLTNSIPISVAFIQAADKTVLTYINIFNYKQVIVPLHSFLIYEFVTVKAKDVGSQDDRSICKPHASISAQSGDRTQREIRNIQLRQNVMMICVKIVQLQHVRADISTKGETQLGYLNP